jgi:RNA polymerase sigma-70 factor (ECF subfamily)
VIILYRFTKALKGSVPNPTICFLIVAVAAAVNLKGGELSTPAQGRGLPVPIIWGRNRERSASAQGSSVSQLPSDEEALARLRAGESQALNLIYDRYSRLVLSIALRILHDYGEAEEVVQDAFFQVFQKASLFEPSKGTAKAWIVQIAYHRALDRRSYLQRRGYYVGTDTDCLGDTPGETDMERAVGAKLNRTHLERAFEELSDLQRRTLELFYFDGLELREITEKLGESLGNVRHHFYRGLERLRKSVFVQGLQD